MKFNVQSKLLLSRLNAVSKVVSNKNAYAILDNFLFELQSDRIVVTGSDMETRLTTNIEVQNVEGTGKFALDVKRTINSLKELPDTALTFEINDETLAVKVTYVNGYYDAVALNGDEFPEKAANANNVKTFSLPAKSIAAGIGHTLFAVGNDDMHPQFTGIYWDIKGDMIVYVASDSHKLVRYRQTDVTPNFERSFILPSKPAAILASIIDRNSDEPVNITVDENSATFENADYQLSCRFINGRYPNYNSVIPEDNPYTMAVDRQTLLNAVRRVAVFANVGGLVRLDLKPTEVVLTAQDVDHSTAAEETITCEYNGEPMNIGFKSADVIDVVSNIDSDGVYLKLLDPARAGVFVPSEQKAGEDLIVLQMPMMI
jgi:DNA polymerase-3 subunit beta